jgi:glycosyltransferase involved in cell wall biosynthesis
MSTIESTTASVLAQTRSDFEHILVDDGSTDGTPAWVEALARRDPRVRLLRQEHQGTAGARNTGVTAARGRLISFLDHDDLWLPQYLERMAAALEGEPGAGFAYTDAWVIDDTTGKIRRETIWEGRPGFPQTGSAGEQLRELVSANYFMSSSTVPAGILREVGGFDAELQGTDDWDLWLRILATGRRAVPAAGQLLLSRDHPAKQSADLVMMLRNDERVIAKVVARDDLPAEVHEVAEAKLADIRRRLTRREAGGLVGAIRVVRDAQVRLFQRLGGRRVWLDSPPPAVAEAFPELAREYGRGQALLRAPA